jgi:hypothetical protein
MKHSMLFAAAVLAVVPACVIHVDSDGDWHSSVWSDDGGPVLHGSGVRTTQARETSEFNAIVVRGFADVHARIGAERRVSVTTDDNLIDKVRTEVRDGALVVDLERGSYEFRSGVVVEVTVPELERLEISGSGDASLDGLACHGLKLSVSGSGNVTANGTVDALTADVSGSGDIDASRVVARAATVSISGSGDIEVQASETLDANISGSGDVRYRGSAAVRSHVSGSGEVERH